jgi:hypothetical protein
MTGPSLIRAVPHIHFQSASGKSPSEVAERRGFPVQNRLQSPEIIGDDMQIGQGGRRAAQARIDDPATCFDGRVIAEIVRCFQNHPGHIRGLVRLRLVGKLCRGVRVPLRRRGLRSSPMFRRQSYISMRMKRRQARRTGIGACGILTGPIQLQNAPGCLDVEATKLVFQIS